MCRRRWTDCLWFLVCAFSSSAWCLTASAQLGPTFDEPVYLERGLEGWRHFSHGDLLQLGTMPLPVDVQTLPLYLWEQTQNRQIDFRNDLDAALYWMRAGNLVFWWLLLWYGFLCGKMLAGSWGGRLAVALLACEPNLLAHAALATTDIAISACLIALLYHFRVGREASWRRRVAVPALWFGLAILAKASAVVYGPICLLTIELERLIRSIWFPGSAWEPTALRGSASRDANCQTEPGGQGISRQSLGTRMWAFLRDLTWIGFGGLTLAVIYCGSDFQTNPSFVEWAHGLPDSVIANGMVALADNLCIFSNAFEGIVRQVKHNVRGHGTFLLGEAQPRSLWYYFPVLMTIKLSAPVLLLPLIILAVKPRALTNWACWTALVLLGFSLTFRVQIGIRLVLPLISIGLIGLAGAAVEAVQSAHWQWARPTLRCAVAGSLLWMTIGAARMWPDGLCYINEFWGGPAHGYELVSDSNYDWGQGIPALLVWQRHNGAAVDVWFFGRDPKCDQPPLRYVPLEQFKIAGPDEVLSHIRGRYLAVSTTMIFGSATKESHRHAAEFLRTCQPAARTTTFLIFEREALAVESARFVMK